MAACTRHPVGQYWKQIVILLTPLLLLLPLLLMSEDIIPKKANHCLFVMLLMAVYWCSEVLPLAITGCIPIFLFPMLSIITTEEVCNQYLKDIVMMFVGGLMVALAVEKCNLHRRIAVSVLYIVGTKPMWLMLGFMLPTWFLSMWISNTATTAMMLPIAEAVLESLNRSLKEIKEGKQSASSNDSAIEMNGKDISDFDDEPRPVYIVQSTEFDSHPDMTKVTKKLRIQKRTAVVDESGEDSEDTSSEVGYKTTGDAELDTFAKGMTLAVAYAANTGGTATLTGTPPNPIMKGHADDIWAEHGFHESPVNFASWCVMGFPLSIINFVIVWLWLTVFFNGCRGLCPRRIASNEKDDAIRAVIKKEYSQLGKIRFAEVIVALMFGTMVVLWFFRSPGFMNGWADADSFTPGYIGDAVVSIFIAFVLCIIPSEVPRCKRNAKGRVETLLDWDTIHKKLPWGIVFLMGGGYSLAKGSVASGLSEWIADGLNVMKNWPGWVMVFVLCIIVAFMTEVTSNSATCTILMPIVSSLAEGIGYNPLYLMFPVALTTSFAFMLPVATPPNAIAFSFGRLKIIDMVKAGFILNFTCVAVVTLATHTWGDAYFKFDVIPWDTNATVTPVP